MGEVWRAHDTQLNRDVALKILPAELAKNADRLHRFKQEARAISALNHPNIITIHEIGQADDLHFIITELVEGESLRTRLQRSPLSLSEALELAAQTARALTAAHEAGIIHRDIKPENIMLRHDGFVKVLDFGLAKLLATDESGASSQTHLSTLPGVVMGTAHYMSPEQARALEVDARSDIFSSRTGCHDARYCRLLLLL